MLYIATIAKTFGGLWWIAGQNVLTENTLGGGLLAILVLNQVYILLEYFVKLRSQVHSDMSILHRIKERVLNEFLRYKYVV